MIVTVLINFCKFLLKSALASVVVFIVSFSLMTNKFPPDFSLVKSAYDIIRNLQTATAKKSSITPPPVAPTGEVTTDDEDIKNLIQQKQKLIKPLGEMAEAVVDHKTSAKSPMVCDSQDNLVHQLKVKIEELDQQNLSLNKRILELKYKKQ